MSPDAKAGCDRRQLLTGAARYAALGGLALLSGGLLVKRAGMSEEQRCRADQRCCDCAAWSRCDLPQAIESRRPSDG